MCREVEFHQSQLRWKKVNWTGRLNWPGKKSWFIVTLMSYFSSCGAQAGQITNILISPYNFRFLKDTELLVWIALVPSFCKQKKNFFKCFNNKLFSRHTKPDNKSSCVWNFKSYWLTIIYYYIEQFSSVNFHF